VGLTDRAVVWWRAYSAPYFDHVERHRTGNPGPLVLALRLGTPRLLLVASALAGVTTVAILVRAAPSD